ncbi:MAG TPA: hypothetical protein VL598_11680 [Trinickia sp.]|jgi:hypothetical protein|uniref:hypothetical protein n=1 Tax=Trinickia sp. TaxID=2571163 RepID=UPI002C0005A6|nr:hypothetical protein [Trinickia sp.]HTI18316.1 hypothetical protein [Trinickia sp.]
MRFPSKLAYIGSVSSVQSYGLGWRFEIANIQAWCCDFSQGLCVALKVESDSLDDIGLQNATLWLASVREALDDALLLDDDGLWLVRRYETELTACQWQALFNHQRAIADWLSGRCPRPHREVIARGRAEGWA